MKKLLLILGLVAGMTAMAQTTPASIKQDKKAATAQTKPAAGPTKKDGTPDKRFKANKTAADTTVVHTKKDGTPDKRFKENKKKN